eukprot:403357246
MGQQCCGKASNPPGLEAQKNQNNLQKTGQIPNASYGKFDAIAMDNPYATVDKKAIEEAQRMQEEYKKSLNQVKNSSIAQTSSTQPSKQTQSLNHGSNNTTNNNKSPSSTAQDLQKQNLLAALQTPTINCSHQVQTDHQMSQRLVVTTQMRKHWKNRRKQRNNAG